MKQRVKITLDVDVDENVPGYADIRTAIHYTLADALGEFRRARGLDPAGVKRYVEERYDYLTTTAEREKKEAQVIARITLAELLRRSINEPSRTPSRARMNPGPMRSRRPCRSTWRARR